MTLRPIEPDRQSFSIVVLGDFNPAIFQPLWFSANGLMPAEETETADVSIIHKQIASFAIGRMQVQVDDSRLGLTTADSPQGPLLRDLAIGTLSVLEHTPLKAIGLNVDMAFVMESEMVWNELGDRLLPKQDWVPFLSQPGMRQILVEGKRSDCSADRINIRVQSAPNRTVLISINQHYQLETADRTDARERHREAIRAMRDDWTSFVSYARDSAALLLNPVKI